MVERIKDLEYASKIAQKAPRESRDILLSLAVKFKKHMNEDYAVEATGAADVVLDSPVRAKTAIASMIDRMMIEKEEYDDR
jgi:hypothetical protein